MAFGNPEMEPLREEVHSRWSVEGANNKVKKREDGKEETGLSPWKDISS